MPAAMAQDHTPTPALMLAGDMFDLSCDAAAATLRAVAVVAEGEDTEVGCCPRQFVTGADAATAAEMRNVNATTLAERPEALPLHAFGCGLDHGRGQTARRPLNRRPSSDTK